MRSASMKMLQTETLPDAVAEGIERHGNGFRAAREAAGLTREELAERSDIALNRILDFEAARAAPERPEAEALAIALGVPSSFFLE